MNQTHHEPREYHTGDANIITQMKPEFESSGMTTVMSQATRGLAAYPYGVAEANQCVVAYLPERPLRLQQCRSHAKPRTANFSWYCPSDRVLSSLELTNRGLEKEKSKIQIVVATPLSSHRAAQDKAAKAPPPWPIMSSPAA